MTTEKRKGKTRSLQPSPLNLQPSYRVGIGNDIHRLALGRKLILGGIEIPFDKGPIGHSDGDALCHAICDALLGAAALGDIGQHFPDTSPKWRNAKSLLFLGYVKGLLDERGCTIANVDATVGIERPKLVRHIPLMRKQIAGALGIKPTQVSVKAKSGEGMDAVGRGEAVRADAVVLISAR